MGQITVDEARDAAFPAGTTLLGGQAGLQRAVTGSATLRARTPAFPALRGGELALVSLPLVRQLEGPPRLERLVAQLAGAAVAAIVLLGVEPGDAADLEAAGRAADLYAVPVFSVPPPHGADAIELALHRFMAGYHEALLRRSQRLQQELTDLALSGRGLPAIVDRVSALTNLPATWEDASLQPRSWSLPPVGKSTSLLPKSLPDLPALLRAGRLPLLRWSRSLTPGRSVEVASLPLQAGASWEASPWRRLVAPFSAKGQVAGYISVICRDSHGAREARLVLEAAGLAASIEALRTSTMSEARGGALSTLLNDWLAGRFDQPGDITGRASQLGHDVTPPYAVVVLESGDAGDAGNQSDSTVGLTASHIRAVAHAIIDAGTVSAGLASNGAAIATNRASGSHAGSAALARASGAALSLTPGSQATGTITKNGLGAPGPETLLWTRIGGDRVALIVSIPGASDAEQAATLAQATLAELLPASDVVPGLAGGGAVFGGVGRAALAVEDIPRTYREALHAMHVARRLGGSIRVSYFGTLGVYRLLAAVSPTEELAAFHDDVLGPLHEQDQRSGGELVKTLETYVLCGGSPQEAAERLHTHRNTILYRLDRISSVLQMDVRQPEHRLTLHLALRAGDILGMARQGTPSQRQPVAVPRSNAASAATAASSRSITTAVST